MLLALAASSLTLADGQLLEFATIDPPEPARSTELAWTVEAFDQRWQLALRDNPTPFTLLGDEARRRLVDSDHRFLAGHVEGIDGSWVRLNWIGGRWSGGFFDGRELYLIDVPGALRLPSGRSAGADQTIVYRFSDLILDGLVDAGGVQAPGAAEARADYSDFVGHLSEIAALRGAMFLMPITLVADPQFISTHGGNAEAVAAGRINFIDGIYASQLGTGIALFHYEALASNGPLTSSDPEVLLVDQFRPFMATGAGSNIPFQGLAHLFTGRNLDGSTVGIAYVGVLCSSGFGYGVDQNLNNETSSALVFAHEVGHNFDAPHDGEGDCSDETFRGIMNPSLNGSQQFSDCSLDIMAIEVAGASCLIDNPLIEVFFSDGFEAGSAR